MVLSYQLYIVYLCIIDQTSIYRYGIYLLFFLIILVLDTIALKKKAENRYTYNILLTLIIMCLFTGEYVTILSIITTLLAIAIYELLKKIKNKKHNINDKEISKKISIGFYLAIPNIIFFIFVLAYYRYFV